MCALTMHFVVLPTETLRDANPSPLLLAEKAQDATVVGTEEGLGYHLEELLGENDMAVLVDVVRVSIGVVDSDAFSALSGGVVCVPAPINVLLEPATLFALLRHGRHSVLLHESLRARSAR